MIFELEKPVIAALPGPAAGAGLSIALACDLRVAAERAFVTTGFGKIGLPGDYGGQLVPDPTGRHGQGARTLLHLEADRGA